MTTIQGKEWVNSSGVIDPEIDVGVLYLVTFRFLTK